MEKIKNNIFSNLKNIKKNYDVVKASPYKSLILKYKMNKGMSIIMGLIIVWRLIITGINFSKGNGWMGLINGIVLLIIGIWFVKSLVENSKKIKSRMEYYEKHGEKMQGHYDTNIDVKSEINDLIKTMKDKEAKING